jgi:hypothetical protein
MAIFGAWPKWHPPVIRQSQASTEGKSHENPSRPPERSELFCPVEADADEEVRRRSLRTSPRSGSMHFVDAGVRQSSAEKDYIASDGRSKLKAVLLTRKTLSSASLHVAAFMMSSAIHDWTRWLYLSYRKRKRAVLQGARRYNLLQQL